MIESDDGGWRPLRDLDRSDSIAVIALICEFLSYRKMLQDDSFMPNDPPMRSPEGKGGLRHFYFHPSKDILYFPDEQERDILPHLRGRL